MERAMKRARRNIFWFVFVALVVALVAAVSVPAYLLYTTTTTTTTTPEGSILLHVSSRTEFSSLAAFSSKNYSEESLRKSQKNSTVVRSHFNYRTMERKGGFVFFLHVPKTGGSTIRDALKHSPDVQYYFVSGAKLFEEANRQALHYLRLRTKRPRPIFVLELHGRDSPNLLHLVQNSTLQLYRRMARQQNIPVFFFTILREPLSYAVSYFNFFHVQRGPTSYFQQVLPTEANLLELSLYNPQCQFLARGEFSLRERIRQRPSVDECQRVKAALLDNMDWVGTTEQLSNETLPLLRHIFRKDRFEFPSMRVSSKARNESIAISQLSSAAVTTLTQLSDIDAELYQAMQHKYSIEIRKRK